MTVSEPQMLRVFMYLELSVMHMGYYGSVRLDKYRATLFFRSPVQILQQQLSQRIEDINAAVLSREWLKLFWRNKLSIIHYH